MNHKQVSSKENKKIITSAIFYRKTLFTLVIVSLLLAPIAPVFGQTIEELRAQIAVLQARLQALQDAQLTQARFNFTRNLHLGMRGDDVIALQNYLRGTGHFPTGQVATGFFGRATQRAVIAWQVVNGISPATGVFGPRSRVVYNRLVAATLTPPTLPGSPQPTPFISPWPTPRPTPFPLRDTIQPTAPFGLTARVVSSVQVDLSWSASRDNVAVMGYRIFRNGVQIGITSDTSYRDTGLVPEMTYVYEVSAYDAAGNDSVRSGSVSVTTSVPPVTGPTLTPTPTPVLTPTPAPTPTPTPTPIPTPTLTCDTIGTNNFFGCYFNSINFTNLIRTRTDPQINFDWGRGSPDPAVSSDRFSVRWQGNWNFATTGNYRFTISSDDGIRVWINDVLVFDRWVIQGATIHTFDRSLTAGVHRVRVDYYENEWDAVARLSWALVPVAPTPTPTPTPSPAPTPTPTPSPSPSPTPPAGGRVVFYSSTDEDFLNPERGFRTTVQLGYLVGSRNLAWVDLAGMRGRGLTMVKSYISLEPYENSSISETYIQQLRERFNLMRQAGIKTAVRFWYTWGYRAATVSRARILQHIEQLGPLLRENSDVITVMQAGFIGAWGEWHSHPGITDQDRRDIFNALAREIPQDRKIQLRYINALRLFVPHGFSEADAFNPNHIASRLGHKNDCFMVNQSDAGTYAWDNPQRTIDRNFLAAISRFMPIGGEMCGDVFEAPTDPYNRRTPQGQLDEFARFNWSFIANDFGPVDRWRQWGIYDTISRRLGYRLALTQSVVPETVVRGSNLRMSLTLRNDGWAAPFNPRPVRVILRNTENNQVHNMNINVDPRRWFAGITQTINIDQPLPAGVPVGNYEVLLHLPDPHPSISARPEYAIRLANPDVWESTTGYNRLNQTVRVQ